MPPAVTGAVAAFCDVDGTLTRTTILAPLMWYQRDRLGLAYYPWAVRLGLAVPRYLWIDRTDRSRVNVLFYRRYAGLDAGELRRWHDNHFERTLKRRLFPEAVARLAEHRRLGHRIVLVTGNLDFIMAPLARHLGVDEVLAARLEEKDGRFTGELVGGPLTDGRKADEVLACARRHGLDLPACHAYTDSLGDLPLLESVGRPVAVNPDRRLAALARRRGWPVEHWNGTPPARGGPVPPAF